MPLLFFPVPRAHARPDSAGGSPAAVPQAAHIRRSPKGPWQPAPRPRPAKPAGQGAYRPRPEHSYMYCNTKLRHRQQKRAVFYSFGQNFPAL